jgi:TolB protein
MGVARLLAPLAVAAALVVAGCGGGSSPGADGPPELLFVSTRDGDYALYGADAGGAGQRRLTREEGDPSTPAGLFFAVTPVWSPDGSRIAFSSSRDGIAHIFVMEADGSETTHLTRALQDDRDPAWSPDGEAVVFVREGALYRAPAAGGQAERVVRQPGEAAGPAYAPDGALVAYDYRAPGSSIREIYVMRPDGTGIRRVTRLGEVSSSPAWSPDGARIAFQSNARSGNSEIFSIAVDGSGLRRETISTQDAIDPAWAPGGGLTFARDGALWTIVDGEERQLTSGDGNDSSPAYRPVAGGGGQG